MTGQKPSHKGHPKNGDSGSAGRLEIGAPVVAEGSALHRITRASETLDVNSCYAYLLWCRDFAGTSVVARRDESVVGFITGYIRPDASDTLFVWQVAVDSAQRGGGVATQMLDHLLRRVAARGVYYLETTITPDNTASINLFTALARDAGASVQRSPLFTSDLLGAEHEPEELYRIGPVRGAHSA